MRCNSIKTRLICAELTASVLLLASGAFAQQQVNLAAGPWTATLPDGSAVPMWGYSCGTAVSGSTATCGALNPSVTNSIGVWTAWSPVVITLPPGQDLQINLTNNLSFTTGSATPANNIPTSLVIVGQLGGGLGDVTQRTTTPSPVHPVQGATWPIVGDSTGATFIPPTQSARVQSFATEVAGGATKQLVWKNLQPGTYLIESGTHPSIQGPMGLYGILVVTTAPVTTGTPTRGVAYPGVQYDAEIPLLFSEIDPAQNRAVTNAVGMPGFSESATLTLTVGLADTVSGITLTDGGSGYTSAPAVKIVGGGTPTTPASAVATVASNGTVVSIQITNPGSGYTSVPSILIDPPPVMGTQAFAAATLSTSGAACSSGAAACYPPAVNYTPLYYLVNGVAFDKTKAPLSLFPTTPAAGITGNVLVRLVNAGLRMHVPSIVGSQTTGTALPSDSGAVVSTGGALIAEDGNPLPGLPRVQSEVFMPAGKTYDVMVNAPAACMPVTPATTCTTPALPIFDRQLSLSANSVWRDGGMLAYIGVNNGTVPSAGVVGAAVARDDSYNALVAGQTLNVSDPAKGVIANDTNVYGVRLLTQAAYGTVTLNGDGTFKYVPNGSVTSDSFVYAANGASACQTPGTDGPCATATLGAAAIESASGITCAVPAPTYSSNVATSLSIKPPGILSFCKDAAGYPLTVALSTGNAPVPASGLTLSVDPNGGFNATVAGPGTYTFSFKPQNAQGTVPVSASTVTLTFPTANGPKVTVLDGADKTTTISDYRWIIEEDRTFFVDRNCTTNPLPADGSCPTVTPQGSPAVFGTNFHTSHMPLVATGCTGTLSCEGGQTQQGSKVVCDQGNGICRPDTSGNGQTPLDPSQVHLDPNKRYYISVLPGDAANPFIAGYAGPPDCSTAGSCGHGMGGAPIAKGGNQFVTVLTQPSPYPPAKLSVFVFEDDFPLNGEHDSGGGIDVLATHETGLGGFQITLFDLAGGTGDATGQPTYDMFNMPLTNSLAGTIDPTTGADACPISTQATANATLPGNAATPDVCSADPNAKGCQKGIVGMIVTCPKYESDGTTLSPLAGQAVVNNLYQGRYSVMATPGADRIARGEEWLQTNTLDGQKAHDSFMRIGEPFYFQEYGPAGFHVSIGFANPKIINDRLGPFCTALPPGSCSNTVTGKVTTARMSRTPDQRLYGSGSRDSFAFTQCYASLGDPEGADFEFVKCDSDGNFTFTGIPPGNWKLTIFDQWNDQIVDGITTPVGLAGASGKTLDLGEVAVHQWHANIYTRTFLDKNGNGVSDRDALGNDLEPGLTLVATNIRFRDGSFSNFNNTDLNGYAGFNEIFPLFSWYVIETDTTRFKSTGVHVVYDAGGPTDGSKGCDPTNSPCGPANINSPYNFFANTYEKNPLPANLHVPGAMYCSEATCSGQSVGTTITNGTNSNTPNSSSRIDPPFWFGSYGWQGFIGQNSFLEFGKKPFAEHENGGIHGHVVYASTRPFDDPQLLLQLSWEPLVPHVRINLYKEGIAADNVTPTLTLVDYTDTSSFDDWAQGFRSDGVPNMNCPGQSASDLFFYSLQNQPQWLDFYNNGAGNTTPLPNKSQFKCYDGMHNWNQLQPAPYDGMYSFPSVTSTNPTTGKPLSTNCTACTTNPDSTDPYRYGTPMLPAGKYVVEVVVPPGYELVKEEDKNILIGDNYIAPVTTQFAGLGSIFILPDQAEVAAFYNANNPQNPTNTLGRVSSLPSHEGDTGSVETFWPCVGAARVVPDYISLFPGSAEVAPFAGAYRKLCDRKEVTLTDQSSALAKFYIFTSTHVASHYTGLITDDFTAEFDPFSPQFGEKFAPGYLPVSIKDWKGNEIARTYSDQWGAYNGLSYSTWEVNPPNPTGYGPTMMVVCMNDRGAGADPDPLFQPNYSQFCYELPFMPGQTGYFDTPVVPTNAFSEGYNHPDCAYPDATPAISRVDSNEGVGPWVSNPATASVASLTLTNGGTGYTGLPTITITSADGLGGGATAVTNNLRVNTVPVTAANRGSGYTGLATVGFSGGGGSGAAATAAMRVNTVSVTAGGSGYTSAPTVTFPGGTGGSFPVTMTANSITLSNRGRGYTSLPTITFNNTGTGGSGAAAVVNDLRVVSYAVTNGGSGYTSAPTVSIQAPPAGVTATATATINSITQTVTSITVVNPGGGYTGVPTVTFSGGGGTGAAATALMGVNTTTISAGGSGYTTRPTVTFSAAPTGGTTAAASNSGTTSGVFLSVNAVTVSNGGSGYTGVTGTFSGGSGTGAAATATLNVNTVTVTSGGTYTSVPSVAFSAPPSGTTATGTAVMAVNSISLTSGGSGYDTAPRVTFSNPAGVSGSGAAATATLGSLTGGTLTITALGNQLVDNYGYSGPSPINAPPFNQKTVQRHYGFGNTPGTVTIGGVTATVPAGGWTDLQITVNVPAGVPICTPQQQAQFGGSSARCGQLVITAANGKQSIDTVTVTIGGKAPTRVPTDKPTIQAAIDAAAPGDLIIVDRGVYNELLLMWKPVRLQGVGAASSIISANSHPAGKLDPWRKQVVCLFGLTLDGRPNPRTTPDSCSTGWTAASGGPNYPTMIVDRISAEGILGWDASLNGNLAEQLQEPGLMGAYEGAAITVLGKGVKIPAGAPDAWGSGAEAFFPDGSVLLTANDCANGGTNPYPSNYYCNPSRIDGLGVTNSSQGGGGIFVHAWGHNIQIANNRVYNNMGTLAGGITIGQAEHIDVPLAGAVVLAPGSCESSIVPNLSLPFCYNKNVNVHHNAVTLNSSLGDELFSSTPAGAGGVAFCNGADYYRFANNWVCGNLSAGDGGGVTHLGFSKNGTIERNSILFNQSTNPTITTNGGGLLVMGAPDFDPPCSVDDQDCVSPPNTLTPTDGTGPGLVINANLIMGNAADSGSGGGLRLQHVNGTDVLNFPVGLVDCTVIRSIDATVPLCFWNSVSVTNNVIVNNVAGWDGAGVSLQDALAVNIINNTIVSNDSTASAGVLFNSLFAPLASSPGPTTGTTCPVNNGSGSCPQVAGLVSVTNSPVLRANLPSQAQGFSCPMGHGTAGGSCRDYSVPLLYNNVIWQNRSFVIGVTPPNGSGTTGQQSAVALYDAFLTPSTLAPSQPQATAFTPNGNGVLVTGGTGACVNPVSYWDIGVRGDSGPGPTQRSSGFTLAPMYSVLTSTAGYSATNTQQNPTVLSQYCNGARVPPENGGLGWQVPPGTNEANALPTPVFSLTPSATVDEGNNWVNLRWGPLALRNPVNGETLGNYGPAPNSPVINYIQLLAAPMAYLLAPSTDFYGNQRKAGSANSAAVDAGAVEFVASAITRTATVAPSPLAFGNWATGTTSNARTLTVTNTGNTALTGGTFTFGGLPQPFSRATPAQGGPGTCGTTLAPGASCTFNVVFTPPTATAFARTLTVAYTGATVTPSPVQLTGTGVANRATVSIAPNPPTITLPPGVNLQTGSVTLANTATTGGAQMTVSSVAVSGGTSTTWFFDAVPGQDLCTGTTLAPGASCTVGVRFNNVNAARGTTRNGTITFTDNAQPPTTGTGSQSGALAGYATPAGGGVGAP